MEPLGMIPLNTSCAPGNGAPSQRERWIHKLPYLFIRPAVTGVQLHIHGFFRVGGKLASAHLPIGHMGLIRLIMKSLAGYGKTCWYKGIQLRTHRFFRVGGKLASWQLPVGPMGILRVILGSLADYYSKGWHAGVQLHTHRFFRVN